MPGVRRGHGDDSVYFDAVNGYWVGSVSLGYSPDGKRRRRTVRGRTKTEVRDRSAALLALPVAVITVPQLRPLVYAAWLLPWVNS
jgi:hypothetical protein